MTESALYPLRGGSSESDWRAPSLGKCRSCTDRCRTFRADARMGSSRPLRSSTHSWKNASSAAPRPPGRYVLPAAHPSSAPASSVSGRMGALDELCRQVTRTGGPRTVHWPPTIPSDGCGFAALAERCPPIASGIAARYAAAASAALLGGTFQQRRSDRLAAQGNCALANTQTRTASEIHGPPAKRAPGNQAAMPAPSIRGGPMA